MRQREKARLRKAVEKAWANENRAEASVKATELLSDFADFNTVIADEVAVDRWQQRNMAITDLGPKNRNRFRAYKANDMRLLAEIGA